MTIEELQARLRELESRREKGTADYESIRRCRLLLLGLQVDDLDAKFRAGDTGMADYINSLHPIVMELSRIMAETNPGLSGGPHAPE